eukprot:Plantae.Rhodophyta-Palmaria_palmata.ctg17846.p1 GENE.Plantae.Rhodophyta-Palmaria_palmata.ctg17846~~Plantae.Rhodophyta-Palmaria_palmata.ctg17846.p1  ORF type:complete len:206 (-),score=38.43 Plantae.Rhodophyta-Palmaria_palmata.ctg17846:211-828(-)
MVHMEGYLSKKGKRIGSRVKRYMKLEGTTLSNHHSPDVPATWQVSIKDATVTANPRRKKLIIELYQAKMELYCDTRQECEKWVECLGQARKLLKETESEGDKENAGAAANAALEREQAASVAARIEEEALAEAERSKPRTVNNLSKSFKVVKPAVRVQSSDGESDEGFEEDEDDDDAHQPRNGPRIYEETPNSMIFRQFAFNPGK